MVNQVPVVTVQNLAQIQAATPVRPLMDGSSVTAVTHNQSVQSNPQDIQNQGTN